jgi:hypothetical protein
LHRPDAALVVNPVSQAIRDLSAGPYPLPKQAGDARQTLVRVWGRLGPLRSSISR